MKRFLALVVLVLMAMLCSVPFLIKPNEKTVQEVKVIEIIKPVVPVITQRTISKNEPDIFLKAENLYLSHMSKLENAIKCGTEKDWYMEYRRIINEYADYVDPPESIYNYYDEEELDRLFRVVQAEIGDEYTFAQKCNVVSVILNRVGHEMFEDDMISVLSADQFETISNGAYKKVVVSDDTMLACEFVFEVKNTANGCLFFDSNRGLHYEFVWNDGAHNFYKLRKRSN